MLRSDCTRFDRVGVLSSQAAQRRETERFVRSLADDEGFCLVTSCTPRGLFRQASLSVPIGRSRAIAQYHVRRVLEIVFVRFCKI